MEKIEFESEEQLKDFIKDNMLLFNANVDDSLNLIKQKGYIKKSDLEIARSEFDKHQQDTYNTNLDGCKLMFSDFRGLSIILISELELEIEKLKKSNL